MLFPSRPHPVLSWPLLVPAPWVSSMFSGKDNVIYLISHTRPQTFLDPDFFFSLTSTPAFSFSSSAPSVSLLPPAAGQGCSPQGEAEQELECSTVTQPMVLGQHLYFLISQRHSTGLGRCLRDGQVCCCLLTSLSSPFVRGV